MFSKRPDGKLCKNIDPFMKIIPYIMFQRNDAMNFNFQEIDCTGLDEFCRREKSKELGIGYMQLTMAAIVRSIYERPEVNRFIMNGRIYQRDKVWMSFTVQRSLRGQTPETTVKIPFEGTESLYEITEKINKAIEENTVVGEQNDTDKLARIVMGLPGGLFKPAVKFLMWCDRHNLLPRSIIDASPFHTSFFITNLKSLGIGTILHHVYNFGTTSLFVSMGKERYLPVVDQKEHITIKKQMELGITTDERICDGLYFARTIKIMKKYLEHPELLEKPCR